MSVRMPFSSSGATSHLVEVEEQAGVVAVCAAHGQVVVVTFLLVVETDPASTWALLSSISCRGVLGGLVVEIQLQKA
jgi:hypothetical protein